MTENASGKNESQFALFPFASGLLNHNLEGTPGHPWGRRRGAKDDKKALGGERREFGGSKNHLG